MPTTGGGTRQAFAIAVLVPAFVALAVVAFAWPAARLEPRELPVAIVAGAPSGLGQGLGAGGFDVRDYPDAAAARTAIEDRAVYGAFEPTADGLTLYVAGAAGATVAQQLETLAGQLTAQSGGGPVHVVDVVPTAPQDPHGVVLSAALLPLVFGGEIIAAVVALLVGVRTARRQIGALALASAVTALAAYAIAQGWLGALPHQHVATWGALTLLLVSISTATAGSVALLGVRGMALAGATMIFLGNPFSGVTSAPQLLPAPVGRLGQLLPPGAGASLLRSAAYFGGHGALGPGCVLLAWTVLGVVGIVVGLRRVPRGAHDVPGARRHALAEPVG